MFCNFDKKNIFASAADTKSQDNINTSRTRCRQRVLYFHCLTARVTILGTGYLVALCLHLQCASPLLRDCSLFVVFLIFVVQSCKNDSDLTIACVLFSHGWVSLLQVMRTDQFQLEQTGEHYIKSQNAATSNGTFGPKRSHDLADTVKYVRCLWMYGVFNIFVFYENTRLLVAKTLSLQ